MTLQQEAKGRSRTEEGRGLCPCVTYSSDGDRSCTEVTRQSLKYIRGVIRVGANHAHIIVLGFPAVKASRGGGGGGVDPAAVAAAVAFRVGRLRHCYVPNRKQSVGFRRVTVCIEPCSNIPGTAVSRRGGGSSCGGGVPRSASL